MQRYGGARDVFQPLDPNPVVVSTAYVKEARAVKDVTNLFILMQMLVEKHFDLVFVSGEGGRGNNDFVSVLVVSRRRQLVHVFNAGEVEVKDPELRELFRLWLG